MNSVRTSLVVWRSSSKSSRTNSSATENDSRCPWEEGRVPSPAGAGEISPINFAHCAAEPTHPLSGGERRIGRAPPVPLLGGVRGGSVHGGVRMPGEGRSVNTNPVVREIVPQTEQRRRRGIFVAHAAGFPKLRQERQIVDIAPTELLVLWAHGLQRCRAAGAVKRAP